MSRQSEIIILDDSSDDSSVSSEPEIRVSAKKLSRAAPPPKKKPRPGHSDDDDDDSGAVNPDLALLLHEDESDASSATDDDYDDGDESFGDGSRAFDRKRWRESAPRPRKPRSLLRTQRETNTKKTPTPTRRRQRDASSESDVNTDGSDDAPYKHQQLVRRVAEAKAQRSKVGGGAKSSVSAPTVGVGAKTVARKSQSAKPSPPQVAKPKSLALLTPVGARKSAPTISGLRTAKTMQTQRRSVVERSGGVMKPHRYRPTKKTKLDDDFVSDEEVEEEGADNSYRHSEEDEEEEEEHLSKRRKSDPPRMHVEIEISDSDEGEEEEEVEEVEEELVVAEEPPPPQPAKKPRALAKQPAQAIAARKTAGIPRSSSTTTPSKSAAPPSPPPSPPSPPASGPPSRRARMTPLAETLPIEVIQAQERELAYFKSQFKRLSALSSTGSTSAPSAAARKAHKTKQSSSSATKPKLQAANRPERAPSPVVKAGFSTPAAPLIVAKTVAAALYGADPSCSHVPIPHNNSWRRLRFAKAPINLLPRSIGPNLFGPTQELAMYDDSGRLQAIATAPPASTPNTDEVLRQSYETQLDVDARVRAVLEELRPLVERCRGDRSREILTANRASIVTTFSTNVKRRRPLGRVAPVASIPVAPIERVLARRALVQRPPECLLLNRLVGRVRYTVSVALAGNDEDGDEAITEREVLPETVIELTPPVTPLRRASTWINVKTNVHVEDDPILRYVPYVGDRVRVNIDPKRYESTTLEKETAFVVELPPETKIEAPEDEDKMLATWREATQQLQILAACSALDDDAVELLLRYAIQTCGRSDKVFSALQRIGGFAQPITDYDAIVERGEKAQLVHTRVQALRQRLVEGEKAGRGTVLARLVAMSTATQSLVIGEDPESDVTTKLRAPPPTFESSYVKFPEGRGLRRVTSLPLLTEWIRDLFCRRCYKYDCELHGIQHPLPVRRMDPVNPVSKKAGLAVARAEQKRKQAAEDVISIDSSSSSSASSGEEEEPDPPATTEATADADKNEGKEEQQRRYSRRSQTRISTLASASLQSQEVIVERERRKQQRKQARRLQKLVRPVDESEYLDDGYRDIIGDVMDALLKQDGTCGSACHKGQACNTQDDSATPNHIEMLLLRRLVPMIGANSCVLAKLLQDPSALTVPTATCSTIHRYLKAEMASTTWNASTASSGSSSGHQDRVHARQYPATASLHSGNRELVKRTRLHRQQNDKDKGHKLLPCAHTGVCDARCACLKRGHDCDKACACPRDCANRHHGCKCVSPGQCRTKSCECYASGRECDPDFCFACGTHEAAVLVFDPTTKSVTSESLGICRNVNLLRGVHPKIGVAFSPTHGWGAFALEPIRKNTFVYEYTGSLISDDEAERRGSLYDAMCVSYLFDVNADQVVDAMRQGNKIKFANHKPQDEANLDTKIMIVNGEHRIALFAKWDLQLGEELFFDYGYTHETAPGWSQVRTPHNTQCATTDEDEEEEMEEDVRALLTAAKDNDVVELDEEEDEEAGDDEE